MANAFSLLGLFVIQFSSSKWINQLGESGLLWDSIRHRVERSQSRWARKTLACMQTHTEVQIGVSWHCHVPLLFQHQFGSSSAMHKHCVFVCVFVHACVYVRVVSDPPHCWWIINLACKLHLAHQGQLASQKWTAATSCSLWLRHDVSA